MRQAPLDSATNECDLHEQLHPISLKKTSSQDSHGDITVTGRAMLPKSAAGDIRYRGVAGKGNTVAHIRNAFVTSSNSFHNLRHTSLWMDTH